LQTITPTEVDHTNRYAKGTSKGRTEAASKGFWKGPRAIPRVGTILTPWFGTEVLDSRAIV